MTVLEKIKPQFLTDAKGNKTSVLLSYSDFQELLEDIEDLAVMAEQQSEATVSHADVLSELKDDGLI